MENDGTQKKRGGKGHFPKGHKLGKRFGAGQPTNLGGRPKNTGEHLLQQLKASVETYGGGANRLAEEIMKIAVDQSIDPKIRFPFIKEANLRIHGQPKSSFDDVLRTLVDKQNSQIDFVMGLSIKVKELAAVNDVKGVLAQLDAEGTLEPMLKEIRGNVDE